MKRFFQIQLYQKQKRSYGELYPALEQRIKRSDPQVLLSALENVFYVHEMAAKNPLVGLSWVPWGLKKMQSRHPYLVHMVVITAFVQNHLFPIENHIKQPKIDEFCILCQFESS